MAKPKKTRGRPPKLTPEVQKTICTAIRGGNFRDVAAQWAGVSVRTMRSWLALGRARKSGPFTDFLHAVLEAECAAEMLCVGRILKASEKDAKHAEWFLERKFPERWGSNRREVKELRNQLAALLKLVSDGRLGATTPAASPTADNLGGEATPDCI